MQRIIAVYLAAFLLVSPIFTQPAQAKSLNKIAIIPIVDSDYEEGLAEVKHTVSEFLLKSGRYQIISADEIQGFFQRQLIKEREQESFTNGDAFYVEAEDLFLSFKLNKALQVVDYALGELGKNPGKLGSLFKAYLLKTQILWELGRFDDAHESMRRAVLVGGAGTALNPTEYSPKVRKFYERASQQVAKELGLGEVRVAVKGKEKATIYANGMFKGIANTMAVRTFKGEAILVTAGTSVDAHVYAVVSGDVVVTAKNLKKGKNDNFYMNSFIKGNIHQLFVQAKDLGQFVGADRVALIDLDEYNHMDRLFVTVVDVAQAKITDTQHFDVVGGGDDTMALARMGSDYIQGLQSSSFSVLTEREFAVEGRKKKGVSKTLLYTALGAVVVGAGVGLAVALSGSSSGGADTDTVSVSLTGPAPSE